MVDLNDVHRRSLRGFQLALVDAERAYQDAANNEDADGCAAAAQQMAGLRASMNELNSMAREAYSAQAAPMAGAEDMSRRDQELCRKYRVSPSNLAIARGWTSEAGLSDEQKIETYLRNSQKLAQDRATGRYRDDQGTVRR